VLVFVAQEENLPEVLAGFLSIAGTRLSTARSKSSFIMTPTAFARPGFMPTGKLSPHTAPVSISQANEGSGLPNWKSEFACGS